MLAEKCFDAATYERMLAGQLPVAELDRVCRHLETCARCMQVAQNLPEDTLVASLRNRRWPANVVEPAFVRALAQKVLNHAESRGQEAPAAMIISCPGCRDKLKVRKESAGQKVKCPKCGQAMQIPAAPVVRTSAGDMAETLPPKGVASSGVMDAATLAPTRLPSVPKDKSAFSANPPAGRVLDDDGPLPSIPGYEVLGILGRGGMGVVYKARHQKLNRLVALKMILAGSHAGAADLARFQVEAEAIARLQHPNIVQVYEIGDHEGKPFFSLEFCNGGSLAQKLNGTPLPAQEAAALVQTLARAMQAAHDQNIIHRDLKPANILLASGGLASGGRKPPDGAQATGTAHETGGLRLPLAFVPKITDFGLAKKLDEAGQTQAGAVMGTPSYMAPEQAGGESSAIGPLADVYTLGAILYECLTGRPPFKAATSLETILQVTMDEPVPPSQLQSKTPKDLETICLKCLQKSPAKRYATATLLAEDLGRFLSGEPVLARPVGKVERAWRWCRRKPALAAASAAAALGVVVALVTVSVAFFVVNNQRIEAEKLAKEKDDLATKERQTADENKLMASAAEKRELKARFDTIYFRSREDRAAAMVGYAQLLPDALKLKEHALADSLMLQVDAWSQEVHRLDAICSHEGVLTCVAFSKDGKTLLTGSDDKTARLWEGATGKQLGPPLQHQARVAAVAFNPNGKTVLTASEDKTARLWDAATGQPLGPPLRHLQKIDTVAFSPDGKIALTGSWDNTARLWDAATGQPLGPPMQNQGPVVRAVFSPDGTLVLTTAGGSQARLWQVATGTQFGPPLQHDSPVLALAFSPDGQTVLTGSGDNTARLWRVATGQQLGARMQHEGWVGSVAFGPDSKTVLTGSIDKTARLWDAATGKQLGPTLQHQSIVGVVAFNPDGKSVLTASIDGTARLWESATGKQLGAPLQHQGSVTAAIFSEDGKSVLTGSIDRTARLWQTAAGQPLGPPVQNADRVWAWAISPDGQTLLLTNAESRLPNPGSARLWQLATGQPLGPTMHHQGVIQSVAFSPDGKTLLTGSTDNTARLWHAATGQPIGPPLQHQRAVSRVAFSPDGKTVLTASNDKTARLWDAATGAPLGPPLQHQGEIHAAVFSPDGKTVLTGSNDKTARLWDAATGQPIGPPLQHQHFVMRVAFSPDGTTVLTGSFDNTARLWDAATGQPRARPLQHQYFVINVAFSPDGKTVLTGSADKTARLWDAATGQQLGSPLPHQAMVRDAAFSPDGKTVLTFSEDNTARLWETATAKQLGPPLQHQGWVKSAIFSPDGKTVLAVCADNSVRPCRVPQVRGDPQQLLLWAQVMSGLELDENGLVHALDEATWRQRRQRLQELGGQLEN